MSLRRAFSTARVLLSESSTSSTATSAPLKRTRDPLLSSPSAQHFTLPSGSSFVVRPPPSTVPSSHPLPPQEIPAAFAAAAQNSPFASVFAPSISSPSVLPSLNSNEGQLPTSRPAASSSSTSSGTQLTPSQIAELQSLRRSDPARWTRGKLAARFGVSQAVVGRFGWGEGSEARAMERERREAVERKRERREEGWGWKKSIAREERRRRRALW
ncbi:hypothetical protein JCM10213_001381 [Rhodosporidiobolus nylandii]